MDPTPDAVRIAAVGDTHGTKAPSEDLRRLFTAISEQADILLLCGDLTDNGRPEEAQVLLKDLAPALKLPVLAVLGNHDFESAMQVELRKIFIDGGVQMLDGESREIDGIGYVGVKGFGGGFGQHALQPWGETGIKSFVQEAVDESVKLESALAKLRVPQRVALLHYSPSASTVEGEPVAIYPFLGSSRLEEPLNRYQVSVTFHGHAHYGKTEGRTQNGMPIFNVAMPLLKRAQPDQPAFRLFSIPKTATQPPDRRQKVLSEV
jgi:Icc-related predicted phosphoesterase